MKKLTILVCLLLVVGFWGCDKNSDTLTSNDAQIDEPLRVEHRGVEGLVGPEGIIPINVNKATLKKTTSGELIKEGDGWVLVSIDADGDDSEQTVYDEAEWVCKNVAKKQVGNYWVQTKLLGQWIAKYLAKGTGVAGVVYHFLSTCAIANAADEFKQFYVKESDGGTYKKSGDGCLWINNNFGWFETATQVNRGGSEQIDYYIGLYFWDNSEKSYSTKATAYLPMEDTYFEGGMMLIWDFDLKLSNQYDAYETWIWQWDWQNEEWDVRSATKIKYN